MNKYLIVTTLSLILIGCSGLSVKGNREEVVGGPDRQRDVYGPSTAKESVHIEYQF